jgi:uncharacterized tellurite resistance protein B-like protein
MFGAIKALFQAPPGERKESKQEQVHLVAAALLVETARADFSEHAAEQVTLEILVANTLQLDKQQVSELIAAAENSADTATSLYEYTRVINDQFSGEEKLQLIGAMWKVAYADDDLNKYEESLIRQVSDLIYVSHKDYIRCKMMAKNI